MSTNENLAALLRASRWGSPAFEGCTRILRASVGVAFRILNSRERAEEVLQELS